MQGKNDASAERLFRWWRLSLVFVLVPAWAASLPFSFVYNAPQTPYGPVGDGSFQAYDAVRSYGLAYGCLVVQTKRRTHSGRR